EAGAVDRGLFLMLRAWQMAPPEATDFRRILRANLAGWSRQLPRLRQVVQAQQYYGGGGKILPGDPEGRSFLTWFPKQALGCRSSATGQRQGAPLMPGSDFFVFATSADGRFLHIWDKRRSFVLDRRSGEEVPGLTQGGYAFHGLPDVIAHPEKDETLF